MEEDIDDWFKFQQEKLEKIFLKDSINAVNSGMPMTAAKQKYKKAHKKIIEDYEKKIYAYWDREKKKEQLLKPVKAINKGMHEFILAFREKT